MSGVLKKFELVATGWTIVQIIYGILLAFGLAPAEIKFVRKPEITPLVHLYPGSQVRLKPEFTSYQSEPDIAAVTWTLQGQGEPTVVDGIEPLISLPPKGGIYYVGVKAKIRNGAEKYGETSIFIVQTEPHKVTAKSDVEIKVAEKELSLSSVEVYTGDGKPRVSPVIKRNGATYMKVDKGQELPIVAGKVFYRPTNFENTSTQGEPAKAGMGYKAIDLPTELKVEF